MQLRFEHVVHGIAAVALLVLASSVRAEDSPIEFNRDVRPLLSDRCFRCHGPDAAARQAELRLDQQDSVLAARDQRHVVVPGRPDQSELVRRVTATDPDERMPPPDSNLALSASEIDVLTRWIQQGAPWENHWAFVAPQRPRLPLVDDAARTRSPIDRFVLKRLEREQLGPSEQADKETLIRRVTLDLIGLPPSVAEIDAFLNDNSPDAFERVVDRALASPRYGEHMARSWLDAARYADTNGFQYDTERTQWPWRDWVINAYNTNQPFDEFTVDQLAGDLISSPTLPQRIATGFNRNHGITIEGGVIDEEYRTEYVVDRVVTTSQVWMSLTFLCARCHDHKYDPISQREFYQFFAFFNQVPERGNSGFDPRVAVADPRLVNIRQQLADLRAALETSEPQIAVAQGRWETELSGMKDKSTPPWVVSPPVSSQASSNATLTLLPDDSTLSGGKEPGQETYEVVLRTDLTAITAIRLEALTHPSLPHNGPGRAFNSNFVLSEFEATVSPLKGEPAERGLRFAKAVADYSQANYEIGKAIDGDPGTGWAVDGPTRKETRVALFTLGEPCGFEGGTEFHIRLRHHYGSAHAIGRFRLALSTRPGVGIGEDVVEMARIAADKRTPEQAARLREHFLSTAAPPDIQRQVALLQALEGTAKSLDQQSVQTMVMQDLPEPRPTHVLFRGQYDQPREQVVAGVPAVFPPLPGNSPSNRLGFARWLIDQAHPLTARVAANRLWQHHFGTGLVKSSEDFGTQGDPPSHPDLLDWLATEFIHNGWNLKALHQRIVTSATYRQSSKLRPDLQQRDPENRRLARGPGGRLEAEVIRDGIVFAAGLLSDRIGGPSVYPYHPAGLWLEINNRPGYSKEYEQGHGEDLYRRSLYTFWKRTVPPPSMQTFDAPEREFCVVRRSATNTPLQAFVLLHDPQYVEAARHLAERMLKDGGGTVDERLIFGFRSVTSRRPTVDELGVLRDLYTHRLATFRADPDAARRLLDVGESPRDSSLSLAEHAACTAVARLLVNLSETVTKG